MSDDTVTVSKARLLALEELADMIGTAQYCSLNSEILAAYHAIPPKPETLIELEGWTALVVDDHNNPGVFARWRNSKTDKGASIGGPTVKTEAEAIAAGNAMLREIAGKVKP